MISHALAAADNNRADAARQLDISRQTPYAKALGTRDRMKCQAIRREVSGRLTLASLGCPQGPSPSGLE
ncbi:helix-turn-helix domain-containing protein [Paraburkholderia sp. GAS82]|uniref:helix-turn-helix domain-containing protein n=1 Tax=Paraburkholderia sp. GAS82 TaxID=3035137 RepID=UPI003D20135D